MMRSSESKIIVSVIFFRVTALVVDTREKLQNAVTGFRKVCVREKGYENQSSKK